MKILLTIRKYLFVIFIITFLIVLFRFVQSDVERCENADVPIKIQMIDDCEYIVSKNTNGNVILHKPDCKNPIHEQTVVHDTVYVIKYLTR